MYLALFIFAVTYVLIVTEIVDRSAAAIIGAGLVILLGLIPHEEALDRVDLNVIFLLAGMMMCVHILSQTGLFEWVAIYIAQKAHGNGIVILAGLLVATAVLSAFLDNVTTVVLIAPITILITQILEIRTVPFLLLEAVFSNIGGTATLIGDPPNILIASSSHLTFNDFLIHLTPVVFICMVVALIVILPLLRRSVHVAPSARDRILAARPNLAITDPVGLRRAGIVFLLILAGFVGSHAIHVEPGIIALCGAVVMTIVSGVSLRDALEKVEWDSIFFLVGLFMLVGSLDHHGIFESLGTVLLDATRGSLLAAMLVLLWGSAILSTVAGSIPVTMALIPLVHSVIPFFAEQAGLDIADEAALRTLADPLWWSLALGACFGGNGSLVGAAANVVVADIARKNGYHFSFWRFSLYGLPVMLLTLALSSVYLWVRYILLG
jgi:Na+/H+ antiporter NhaD/arsenite permease-like protein